MISVTHETAEALLVMPGLVCDGSDGNGDASSSVNVTEDVPTFTTSGQ